MIYAHSVSIQTCIYQTFILGTSANISKSVQDKLTTFWLHIQTTVSSSRGKLWTPGTQASKENDGVAIPPMSKVSP